MCVCVFVTLCVCEREMIHVHSWGVTGNVRIRSIYFSLYDLQHNLLIFLVQKYFFPLDSKYFMFRTAE